MHPSMGLGGEPAATKFERFEVLAVDRLQGETSDLSMLLLSSHLLTPEHERPAVCAYIVFACSPVRLLLCDRGEQVGSTSAESRSRYSRSKLTARKPRAGGMEDRFTVVNCHVRPSHLARLVHDDGFEALPRKAYRLHQRGRPAPGQRGAHYLFFV